MTTTTFPRDPLLDLDPWVGQRSASFRFALSDAVSGLELGDITPIRGAKLSHDTARGIKRQLNLNLGAADTAAINPLTERINLYMTFPRGVEYPMGRYIFTASSRSVFTSGKLSNVVLNDEMYLVDQQLTAGFDATGFNVATSLATLLAPLPITIELEPSPFTGRQAWQAGTTRGQVCEALAVSGDYFSPWFDNNGVMRFIRTFNPAGRICDFDFDNGNKVARAGIVATDDLLNAPNVFVVISNNPVDPSTATVGVARVPPSSPNSFARRGFEIVQTVDLQLNNPAQAQQVAEGLANRQTIFERVSLTTAPDPRHDSYNVIRWLHSNWLELAWSMELVEGGVMTHLLRKGYAI